MRWSISTRIFLGFAAIIFAFGSVGLFGIWQMQQLRRNVQLERKGILPLAGELSSVLRELTVYEDELGGTTERDLIRLKSYFHKFKPFDGVARVGSAARSIENDFELEDTERTYLSQIANRTEALRTDHALRSSLELSAGPVVSAVLAESPNARQVDALYRVLAHAFVARLHEGKVAEARALKDVLAMIIRRTRNGLVGVQREARKLVAQVDRTAQSAESQTLLAVSVATGAALVAALIIMLWAGFTLRPLRQLGEGARRVAQGDFTAVTVDSRDEIGQLADEFNRMATSLAERDRLLARQREELMRSDRLATIGKMSSQITHEIRNPLSSIGLNTELLEDELLELGSGAPEERTAEARTLLHAIRAEIDRLAAVTEQYLRFARLPRPDLDQCDLNQLIKDLMAFLQGEISTRSVVAQLELAADLPELPLDLNQIRQTILNLVRNALEAMEGGGRLAVVTRVADNGAHVELEIGDNGVGIDAETLPRVFEPFFSTKETGTGLGLALVQQIVSEHRGTITCDSTPGEGTTFVIRLPTEDLG